MKKGGVFLFLVIILLLAACPWALGYASSDWAASELSGADRAGILPDSLREADLTRPITRREFCQVVLRTYNVQYNTQYAAASVDHFRDTQELEVNAAYELGLVRGYSDGSFRPDNAITRQEFFQMLYNLISLTKPTYGAFLDQEAELARFADCGSVAEWAREAASAVVAAGLVNGTSGGRLAPLSTTSREQAVAMAYRFLMDEKFQVGIGQETAPLDLAEYLQNPALTAHGYWDAYNAEKHKLIFGSLDVSRYDASALELAAVQVPVWRLRRDGSKYSSTATLEVNARLAPVVLAIFEEIYAGPEQFPIQDVGGYRKASERSEHTTGLAIDINSASNPQISKIADPYAAGYRPGEDPYSISPEGDVVRAFQKYGFFWGGEGWSSSYDFMHFSYFGT